MLVFETERLLIKRLEIKDKSFFVELFSDPKIINPIPQPQLPEEQILKRFTDNLSITEKNIGKQKCVFGIFEKGNTCLIGLALFLINENNEQEIGYRFLVKYWGNGYATETTKGMINYYFNVLKVKKVTADVAINNLASAKVVSKFLTPLKEFFNSTYNCTDRRYQLYNE